MSSPATDDGAGTGLKPALQRLGGHLLELLQVRLELLGTELEAEKLRVVSALVTALLAVMLVTAAVVMLSLALLLLSPEGWRWAVALGLCVVYAGLGYAMLGRARDRLQSPEGVFAASAAELARDRDALGGSSS